MVMLQEKVSEYMEQRMKKKEVKKKFKKTIFGVIAFWVVVESMELISDFLYPQNDITRNWQSFYALEENSVDILIVGSSHAYSSFNPEILGENLGQQAYVLASSSQNVTQTYFNVKEAIKYQKPEMLILETFGIDNNNNWQGENEETPDKNWKKESNIDGMRLGIVKLEAIAEQYLPENWCYALFKIARCHGNWKDTQLIMSNYDFFKNGIDQYSGFRPSESVMSEETMKQYEEMAETHSEYKICEENETYYHKLAQLCKENEMKLYMIMAPMYDGYIKKINYESRYQQIAALAQSEGVEYLDCNKLYDEIGLDATDFEDAFNSYHHLNRQGADKVTTYVAEVLKK